MAHVLFKACSEGNLSVLNEVLPNVNPLELETQGLSSIPLTTSCAPLIMCSYFHRQCYRRVWFNPAHRSREKWSCGRHPRSPRQRHVSSFSLPVMPSDSSNQKVLILPMGLQRCIPRTRPFWIFWLRRRISRCRTVFKPLSQLILSIVTMILKRHTTLCLPQKIIHIMRQSIFPLFLKEARFIHLHRRR